MEFKYEMERPNIFYVADGFRLRANLYKSLDMFYL